MSERRKKQIKKLTTDDEYNGIIVFTPDGERRWVDLSGGASLYAQASEDMTADYDDTDETTIANTTYSATILNADGTASDTTMEVARQADVEVKIGQHGIIARSDDGVDVFILTVKNLEVRDDDPSAAPGRQWLRSDLA